MGCDPDCLSGQHDPYLIIVAALICLVSTAVGIGLFSRARLASGWTRRAWTAAAGLVMGGGVWSTHFVAMLAYHPGMLSAYDLELSVLSIVTGMALAIAAFEVLHAQGGRVWSFLAGMLLGGGLTALHFVGMKGPAAQGTADWDVDVVTLCLLAVSIAGGFALLVADRATHVRHWLAAAFLLTAGVLALHFIGMGAAAVIPSKLEEVLPSLGRGRLAFWVTGTVVAVLALSLAGMLVDHLMARRTLAAARRLSALANAAFEGIVICRGGVIADANESFARLVGSSPGELTGRDLSAFIAEPQRALLANRLEEAAPQRCEIDLVAPGGPAIPVEMLARRMEPGGQTVVAVRDLRERRLAEDRIRFLAHHDPLTGLANRAYFHVRLEEELARQRRTGGRLAVLAIDLDRFKEANDSFGHSVGDDILRLTAAHLRSLIRPGEFAGRLGGDEFLIIVPMREPDAATALAGSVVRTITDAIAADYPGIVVSASVGIAYFPDDGQEPAQLLRNADMALYRAKEEGRDTFCVFESSMAERLRERRTIQRDLSEAVAGNGLFVVYQPLVNVADLKAVGFEALVRWNHPRLGPMPPTVFIPIAEEAGLIGEIGRHVLATACGEAAGWPSPLKIAVNLSPSQILDGDLPDLVARTLAQTGLEAGRLELEITETVLIKDMDRVLGVLRRLKALGVGIAMDDFGTGYSSLSYLQAFPFDKIKIDRSFISELDSNIYAQAIVRAVIGLGQTIGVPIVAEGVETQAQLDLLARQHCDQAQGTLIGSPQAIEAYRSMLAGMASQAVVVPGKRRAVAQ